MLGFIVAVAAGFFTPHIEGPVARPLAKALGKHIKLESSETRLLAFIAALLGGCVAASLLNSGSAFWITLGAAIGYFGSRLMAAVQKLLDERNNR